MQNEQVPSDASDDDDDDDDARRVGSGPSHPRLEVGRHGEQSRRDETRMSWTSGTYLRLSKVHTCP
jgi:hypothetical protein